MAKILVIRDEELERLQRYANQDGVSGGWQNLCRKLLLRVVDNPGGVADAQRRVEDGERGLFGPGEPPAQPA